MSEETTRRDDSTPETPNETSGAAAADKASAPEKQAPAGARKVRLTRWIAGVVGVAALATAGWMWRARAKRAEELAAAHAAAQKAACGDVAPYWIELAADKPGGLPKPGDSRVVSVEQKGYVFDEEGSLILDPKPGAVQPIYRVVVKTECNEKPRAVRLLGVDRELGEMSNLWVTLRAGNTPVPDGKWSAPTPMLKEPVNEIVPRLFGAYVEATFTLVAAERPNGPKLKGFRLCYACGKDAQAGAPEAPPTSTPGQPPSTAAPSQVPATVPPGTATPQPAAASTARIQDFTMTSIDGQPQSLATYKGKVLLVVNTASGCGFTPQYEGLVRLHEKLKGKGFSVLGFPANDFGAQEPGSDQEIKAFCDSKFHVSFPLFSKSVVLGPQKSPLYAFLTAPPFEGEIKWNFEKFLIGKDGKVAARYHSAVEPEDAKLVADIEAALAR